MFNLDLKTRIKSLELNEHFMFWKWLNSTTIAYITTKAIYHWSIDPNSAPVKQCDVLAEDFHSRTKILNYDASKDGKFLFLQGIEKNPNTNKMEGILRLYSKEKQQYRPKMNGHGASFAYLNIDDRDATLFCCVLVINGQKHLIVAECGNINPKTIFKVRAKVGWENDENDFVVSMIASELFSCLYAVTQRGVFLVFDIQTAKCIKSHVFPNVKYCLFCYNNYPKKK